MDMTARGYYENLFRNYDDVVDLNTLREMLGGVSDSYVRRLLRSGEIKSFRKCGKDFMIPKSYVIDFVLCDKYQNYKHKLKVQI